MLTWQDVIQRSTWVPYDPESMPGTIGVEEDIELLGATPADDDYIARVVPVLAQHCGLKVEVIDDRSCIVLGAEPVRHFKVDDLGTVGYEVQLPNVQSLADCTLDAGALRCGTAWADTCLHIALTKCHDFNAVSEQELRSDLDYLTGLAKQVQQLVDPSWIVEKTTPGWYPLNDDLGHKVLDDAYLAVVNQVLSSIAEIEEVTEDKGFGFHFHSDQEGYLWLDHSADLVRLQYGSQVENFDPHFYRSPLALERQLMAALSAE